MIILIISEGYGRLLQVFHHWLCILLCISISFRVQQVSIDIDECLRELREQVMNRVLLRRQLLFYNFQSEGETGEKSFLLLDFCTTFIGREAIQLIVIDHTVSLTILFRVKWRVLTNQHMLVTLR